MTKIAACLIVKDAAEIIEKCLDSIRQHVDEIDIYDTGSTDGTLELLEKLNERTQLMYCPGCAAPVGAPIVECQTFDPSCECDFDEPVVIPLAPIRVEHGEWRDDFSWAREQSFAMCSDDVDWVIWLDDDDVVAGAENLRHLAENAPPDLDAFGFLYNYAQDEAGTCVCQLWRERLIRRSAGYVWRNPIHEVLVPPEGKPPAIQFVPPQVIRYIHDRPADRYDAGRNLAILLREKENAEAEGRSPDPRTLAYLGTEYMAKGEFAEAATYLNAYIRHPESLWSDERAQVHHKLANCLNILGNPMGAIEVELQAVKERHDWAENYVGLAQSYMAVGNWPAALHYAENAQKFGMPQSALILNPLEFSLVPIAIACDAHARLGHADEARKLIAQLVGLFPQNAIAQQKAAEIERMVAENEIVAAVLKIREVLIRHDEPAKAWQLMNAIPYLIAERPEIVRARYEQKEMVAHLLRPEEYDRFYEDEPKVSNVPIDYMPDEDAPPAMTLEERAKTMLVSLRDLEETLGRKPRVLDLGCNDGLLGCYLWKYGGYKVDAIEQNHEAAAKARERYLHHEAKGRVLDGNLFAATKMFRRHSYDAIALFEVLEHLPDPFAALDLMEEMLAPGGRIYLSTPNGAFELGQREDWAQIKRKDHLYAWPAQELLEILSERGEIVDFQLQCYTRESYAVYRPRKLKGKVVFFAGGGWEEWAPDSINSGGLGGSETCLVHVAVGLAQEGWQVKVYSSATPGFYAGSIWRPASAFDPSEDCDLLVVSRLAEVFDTPLAASRKVLWCHDNGYPGMTPERVARMDQIVVLSDWQKERFARLYPSTAEKLVVIRNGISLTAKGEPKFTDAERPWSERKPRCIYSSSADRGLDVLLEVWPRIRTRVPDAELHVFYGWNVFDAVARRNPALYAYKAKVLGLIEKLGGEEGGVVMRGRVGQKELTDEMTQARVLAYPTAFLETSCITAMEAKAAGLPIVTSDLGALHETAARQMLIPWRFMDTEVASFASEAEPVNESALYQDEFVGLVVAMLENEGAWTIRHDLAISGATENAWENRIADWAALVPAQAKRQKYPRQARRVA